MKSLAFAMAAATMAASMSAYGAQVFCNGKKVLTQAEIASAVEGKYACGSSGGNSWNELHAGGTITDYKLGPSSRVDPPKVVGSYAIGSDVDGGIITDSYLGGGAFSYHVSAQNSGGSNKTFFYCGIGGAPALLTITIQSGHC